MLYVFYFKADGTKDDAPEYRVYMADNAKPTPGYFDRLRSYLPSVDTAKWAIGLDRLHVGSSSSVDALYTKIETEAKAAAVLDAANEKAWEAAKAAKAAKAATSPRGALTAATSPRGAVTAATRQRGAVTAATRQRGASTAAGRAARIGRRAPVVAPTVAPGPVAAVPTESRGRAHVPSSDAYTPPSPSILHSQSGIAIRGGSDPAAKLLPPQWLAMKLITGLRTTQPGLLRSALIFHTMGSGKTVIVHALLNYLAGAISRAGKSLACRVVLVWQTESAKQANEELIRLNSFNVFAAVRPRHTTELHRNVRFTSIGIGRDDVLDALQIMSPSMAAELAKRLKGKNAAKTSAGNAQIALTDARHALDTLLKEQRESRASGRPPSEIADDLRKAREQVARLVERTNVEGAASREPVRIEHAACAQENSTLFVVDEVHELFREVNAEMYYALLTAVSHGHARVVLMSGTPISSESPIADCARLLLLVGGRSFIQWILAGSKSARVAELRAAVDRMTYAALNELTTPFYSGTARYRGVLANPSHSAIKAIQAEAAAKLDQMKATLREVETVLVGILLTHTDPTKLGVVLDRMCEHDSIAVSYYGRMNGNLVDYEKNREDFSSYEYKDLARMALLALKQPVVAQDALDALADGDGLRSVLDGAPGGARIVRGSSGLSYDGGRPAVVIVPKFTQSTARHLVVTVPPYVVHPARAAKMSARELIGDVSAAEVAAWLTDNMKMSKAWDGASVASREAEVFRNYGRYALAWALCVARIIAYTATRSKIDQQKASAVVLMVDRHTYGMLSKGGKGSAMSREEMELIVHLVLGDNNHPVFRKAGLPEMPERKYRLAFNSTLASDADADADEDETEFGARRPRRVVQSPRKRPAARHGDPPAHRSRSRTDPPPVPLADGPDQSVSTIEGFDLEKVRAQSAGLFGKVSVDVTSSPSGIEMLVQDVWTDDVGSSTLAVAGYDYAEYDGICVVGLPRLEATTARQLVSRIDRVSVAGRGGKKRRRFVVFIREPSMQAIESIGGSQNDRRVSTIELALVRAARDCANNVQSTERASFECAPQTRTAVSLFV